MKLICDGRRLDGHIVADLLSASGSMAMASTMEALGFQMKPVRAPRGLRRGNLVLRFVWEKRDGNMRAVIRSTIILEAAGLV